MLAFLGIVAGELFPVFFGSDINGPAIYQYQQAESIFPAWSANVVGLTLAVEVRRRRIVGLSVWKTARLCCCGPLT